MLRFEADLLDWFRSRHGDVLSEIKNEGTISDEDAFEAAIKDFADQFVPTVVEGEEPDAEEQGGSTATTIDSDVTLPEEDITRDED